MKTIKKYPKANKWILPFVFLFIISCSKENELVDVQNVQQENFIGLSLAKEIASGISFKSQNLLTSKNEQTVLSNKTIETINEIKNNKGKTVFYVINYIEGGFIILSADNRARPIIGFSDDDKFIIDKSETTYPIALKSWIEKAKEQISIIQNSTETQTEDEKLAWRQVKNIFETKSHLTGKVPQDKCYEHTETDTKGPYLKSMWGQQNGYNSALRYISCGGSNFQIYAGCVPISMAQVMKYYEYPTNYDWSLMPLNYATYATADFILDIHNAIGSLYSGEPSFDCTGTGVSSNDDMGQVLKSKFHYTSADYANYNFQVVKSNLAAGKPVILSGFGSSGGHMWVCDGYTSTSYYYADCTGLSTLYLHMNWGWDGSNNGYYAYNNFSVASTDFNSNTKMVYNITP